MNKWFWVVIVAIACVTVALLLYSNPAKQARMAYEQALAVELKSNYDKAEKMYDDLIATYPGTDAADLAGKGKERIAEKRTFILSQEMQSQIDSILLVMNGYKSMFGHLPESIEELDNSEYFFDSAYIAELVPQGYTTYVVLGENAPFGIWPLRADKETVYAAIGQGGDVKKMDKAEALKQIETQYAEAGRQGNVVFLKSK